jgi:hypothetical protein
MLKSNEVKGLIPEQSTVVQKIPIIRVRVSTLCKFDFCPKRARIELFCGHQLINYSNGGNDSMKRGSIFHFQYSCPYKSFDRRLLRYQLEQKYGKVFEKTVDNLVIRGSYDDVRVLFNPISRAKVVSLIEVKTTYKQRMWNCEIDSATMQLQLYIWLMKEAIESLGWTLHSRHYLEIFSQKTNRLIKRIVVYEEPAMEERIRHIMKVWQGVEPLRYPPESTCKICPKNCKTVCDRWINRKLW